MTSPPRAARPRGVRARIVTTTALLTLVGMAALVALTALVLARISDADARSFLADRAEAVAHAVVGADGTLDRRPDLSNVSDEVSWVFDDAGLHVHGPTGTDLDRSAARLGRSRAVTAEHTDGWLLYATPLPGGVGVVVVGASLRPYQSTLDHALLVAAALGLLVVAAVTALSAWVVTRALRPVTSMARAAAEWSEAHLDRRFDLGPPDDEITELGAVLDALLGRVAGALTAEQRLTSELAHELRTPLTVVRAEAELALHGKITPDESERLARIIEATDHMASVIETLLGAARGAAAADVSAPVGELLEQVVGGPALGPASVPVVVEGDVGLSVATPLDVAARALSPLVANAVRHARAQVTLRAVDAGALVAIEVEDDGAGVAPDQLDSVFVPGQRSPDSPGAGLGLPLARRVARASGGDVHVVADRPSCFVLTLPKAARARS